VVRAAWPSRDRLGRAQIFGRRLAVAAVLDDVEGNALPLVEGAQTGAFDRADMNEDVLPAIGRLNDQARTIAPSFPVRRFWRSL